MLRFILAFWLAITPALADGVSVPGVPSIGMSDAAFRFPPATSAGLSCSYTPATTATNGTPYTGATPSASGGTPSYTFSETGSLPTGLSISSSTGIISGTPSATGSFPSIQVKVTDSASNTANCGSSFTLVVSGGGGSPTYVAGAAVSPQANGFAGGTVTFSNLNGGTNFPSGAKVYVGVGQDQGATPLSSPKIGGNTATIVTGSQDSSTKCQVYYATMPSSSPDTFTFTNGNAVNQVGVASAYMTNVTATPTAASNQTFGGSSNPQGSATHGSSLGAITIPATGFGFAFVFGTNTNTVTPGANALTWTNTTSGAGDIASPMITPFDQVGAAHSATAGSWLPNVSDAANQFTFSACMSTIAVGP